MTLAAAITQFETWTPTGFNRVAALSNYSGQIVAEDMPLALLGLQGIGGQGFRPFEFGGSATWTVSASIWLVASGVGQINTAQPQAAMVTLFDNFASAVKADPDLNGNLARPMGMELVSISPVSINGFRYSGWELRSIWVLSL